MVGIAKLFSRTVLSCYTTPDWWPFNWVSAASSIPPFSLRTDFNERPPYPREHSEALAERALGLLCTLFSSQKVGWGTLHSEHAHCSYSEYLNTVRRNTTKYEVHTSLLECTCRQMYLVSENQIQASWWLCLSLSISIPPCICMYKTLKHN